MSHVTRAIFYANIARGLAAFVRGDKEVDKIRFLKERAQVSRTQAQRLIKGLDADTPQGPSIDLVACIAEGFGVSAAELLTQGCKFSAQGKRSFDEPDDDAALGSGHLQR